jgi:endonuclease/exonuclease/phosphatase family metal-dependent hydrolase
MRVVTWNIQAKSPARVGLDRLVADVQPDILLLQEADGAALESDPALAASHPHRFTLRDAGRPGIAILSAGPVRETGVMHEPWNASGRPRLLWADLDTADGARLVVAAVHTTSPQSVVPLYDPRRRNRQLEAIRDYVQQLVAEVPRLVLGGDFNTISYAIPGMTDAALAAGRPGATWRGLATRWIPPLLRLDRVYLGPGLSVREARVGTEFAGSDHCPVIVEVDVTAPR